MTGKACNFTRSRWSRLEKKSGDSIIYHSHEIALLLYVKIRFQNMTGPKYEKRNFRNKCAPFLQVCPLFVVTGICIFILEVKLHQLTQEYRILQKRQVFQILI